VSDKGFRTETRLPGETNEAQLFEVLSHWLTDVDIEPHLDTYDRDYWVLRRYLLGLYGSQAYAVMDCDTDVQKQPARYIADIREALMLPALTGLDPRDPSTSEWAHFLCHRWDTVFPDPEIQFVGRFGDPAEAYRRIRLADIPFDYLKALDCGPTPLFPLDAIIDAWNSDIPVEYAREAIYGVST
jgi:hypothetical protein